MNERTTKPWANLIWCHSCVGVDSSPAEDLPKAPEGQANNKRSPQRGLDDLPNTAVHTLTNAHHKTALVVDQPSSLVKRGSATEEISTEQQGGADM